MPLAQAGSTATAAGVNRVAPQIGTSAGQPVTSTSPVAITGFSAAVVSGLTYLAYCWIIASAASGGQGEFRWTGPASPTLCLMQLKSTQIATSTVTVTESDQETSTGYNGSFLTTQTFAATRYRIELWMTLTPSAGGTLALEAANTAGTSDTWSIVAGSYMRVEQQIT